ncbi:hydrolase 2, exosortase A system-associated [Janthinobacterium aquaticum]|uniref:hydrolase 2, exosortase A system-associated n=1 Tax=Janthinobacterium sp. FT58W TaxID=2654254 RepID=UPI00126556E8|nr:hydrolase 2, exosortase A system-associated [Janthinobacterium sp. FT58W]KAB8041591.1 hydrolase 2, exosortase A system-associated [Janthinobacterium sp. FT58W]
MNGTSRATVEVEAGAEAGVGAGKAPGLLPFYLPTGDGQRFCLLHLPAPGEAPRGGIVYLHPLAEEMNKSRHIAAAQARAFAQAGYSVLQFDLYGCGDSSGDFAEARWAIWRNDVQLACAWLAARVGGPLTLWGLRLGALLALDLAAQLPTSSQINRLLLWQPELDGRRCLARFLRLHLAAGMLQSADARADARQELAAGRAVEVAGYCLSAALAHDLEMIAPAAPRVPVYWLQQENGGSLPPVIVRQAASWRDAGATVHLAGFDDGAFWQSGELLACPHLFEATRKLCADWLATKLDDEGCP